MRGEMTAAQKALQRRGLKQVWLAGKLGMSPSALTRRLRGERPFTTDQAHKIEDLTGIPFEVFVGEPNGEVA